MTSDNKQKQVANDPKRDFVVLAKTFIDNKINYDKLKSNLKIFDAYDYLN